MYRPGKLNGAADALSRREENQPSVHAISAPTFELFDVLREEYGGHPRVASVREMIKTGTAKVGWTEADDLLLFNKKGISTGFLVCLAFIVGRRPCSWA